MPDARSFWVTAPGRGELRTEQLPAAGNGSVLVRTRASGISRGTESLVFNGWVPRSQWAVMRCPFQAGDFPAPVKYGYASVGTIEKGPSERIGERVFCLHPHQDLYRVPLDAVLPVPADVPDRRAVLAANLETAVNGLWDAAPGVGDRIAIVGAGVIGGLCAALLRQVPGVELELIDVAPGRAALAEALDVPFRSPGRASGGADLVIHASGSAEGLSTALALAGFEATVLEMSWYGDAAVSAPLGETFHSSRLTLRASQVGEVAASRRPRWDRRRRLALALRLLADPRYDAFLTGESRFEEMPEIMPTIAGAAGETLCHVIRYD